MLRPGGHLPRGRAVRPAAVVGARRGRRPRPPLHPRRRCTDLLRRGGFDDRDGDARGTCCCAPWSRCAAGPSSGSDLEDLHPLVNLGLRRRRSPPSATCRCAGCPGSSLLGDGSSAVAGPRQRVVGHEVRRPALHHACTSGRRTRRACPGTAAARRRRRPPPRRSTSSRGRCARSAGRPARRRSRPNARQAAAEAEPRGQAQGRGGEAGQAVDARAGSSVASGYFELPAARAVAAVAHLALGNPSAGTTKPQHPVVLGQGVDRVDRGPATSAGSRRRRPGAVRAADLAGSAGRTPGPCPA